MRRRLFFPQEERRAMVESALRLGFSDLVYLATCNRIEFYTTAADPFVDLRPHWIQLFSELKLPAETYYSGYHLEGKSAVRHLMRVASSLESLVVGEPQILGQLKDAVADLKNWQLPLSPILDKCFQLSFETAKRVRSETAIAERSVSVATLALQYLETQEPLYQLQRAVVVGRSPISRTILQWFAEHRPSTELLWVNRDLSKLDAYPEFRDVKKQSLVEFLTQPSAFSHLFTATSSREPLFTPSFFERAQSKRALVFDLAEPMDVADSQVNVVRLDDFKEQARANTELRMKAVGHAERILEDVLKAYCQQQKEAPVLRQFNAVEEKFFAELASQIELLDSLPSAEREKVQRWAESLLKKNLHHSRDHLKHILRRFSEPSDALEPSPVL